MVASAAPQDERDLAMMAGPARHVGPFNETFHQAAELVGKRWTGAILFALAHGLHRFSELEAAIPGLSARLLTERLRELEDFEVVKRVAKPDSRRHAYALTDKGEALRPVLAALDHWAVTWPRQPDAAVIRPD